jgi:DNA-directed RNA polymerase specialized sigma subunit
VTISKELLSQYTDLQKEIAYTQEEIQKTEDSIAKLLKEGTVVDKVKGGLGGIEGFKIEGFPQKEYDRRKNVLNNKINRLFAKETDLLQMREQIEVFIDEIQVSRDRIIFKALFLDNKTQQQIADELYIDRSLVSKIIAKYF